MTRGTWRHGIRLMAAVAALVVAITATPAAAAGNGRAVERPYREMTFNDVNVGSCAGFPVLICDFTLEGQLIGTHIGRADDVGWGTARIDFSQPCVVDAGLVGNVSTGEFAGVITAADGSELFYEGASTQCVVSGASDSRSGSWWITGGTGRFEGASGTIELGPVVDGSAVNVGTITF